MSGAATPRADVSRTGTPVQQLRGAAALAAHAKQQQVQGLHEAKPGPGMTQPRRSYSKTYV